MEQENLFFDGPRDALQHLVRVLGGAKKVGHELRPGKSPDDAGRWLMNALDGERRDTLHLEDIVQLMHMGRQAGCHVVMEELARVCGYTNPQPHEPEDERAALQRQYIAAVRGLDQIAKRLERIV